MRHRLFLPVALAAAAGVAAAAGAQQTTPPPAPQSTPAADTVHPATAARPRRGRAARPESAAELQKQAKVSMDSAKAVALATVPGATIQSSELEREHGKLLYSFDMRVDGKSGMEEVHVDALTGKLLAHEHETPKAEKTEARKEKREAVKKGR